MKKCISKNLATRKEEKRLSQSELIKKNKKRYKKVEIDTKKIKTEGELKVMIKAIGDKIIVELMRRVQTKGGIIIPDAVGEPQGYGLVQSLGEDVENLKIGDVLVFHPRAGMDMLLGKKILKTLKYEEVYGILDEDQREELVTMEIGAVSEGVQKVRPVPGGGGIIVP